MFELKPARFTSRLRRASCGGALALVMGASVSTAQAAGWPNEGKKLVTIFQEGTLTQRLAAVEKLGSLSASQAREPLQLALSDSESRVRISAAHALVSLNIAGWDELAIDWLQSKDAAERHAAVLVLGGRVSKAGLVALAAALSDQDVRVRRSAAVALGRTPQALHKEAQPLLVGALNDDDRTVRLEAVASLGRVGHASVAPALATRLQDSEWRVRAQVALALGVLNNQVAVPSLIVATSDQEEEVVRAVIRSLGRLGDRTANSTIISLLIDSPHPRVRREAIEALSEIGGEKALQQVVHLVTDTEVGDTVKLKILSHGAKFAPYVLQLMQKASGDDLSALASLYPQIDRHVDVLVELYQEGRLSRGEVIEYLTKHPSRRATVLAVEALSSTERGEQGAALGYLDELDPLPPEIEGLLFEALSGQRWVASEVERLLTILSHSSRALSEVSLTMVREYLKASDDVVRNAAARLLVARGVHNLELEGLIVAKDPASRSGAFEQLSAKMTLEQAATVISMLAEGQHGEQGRLQRLLVAVPTGLNEATVEQLQKLVYGARGAARDFIYNSFVVNGSSERLLRLAELGSQADHVKLAQVAYLSPQGRKLAAWLVGSAHPRTVALAIEAVGRRGGKPDVQRVLALAQGDSTHRLPHFVQAAALGALRDFYERKVISEVPSSIITEELCHSPHTRTRVETLRLASALGRTCGSTSLPDVLHLDPDPRLRQVAAQLLQKQGGGEDVLRRCAVYEPRRAVSRTCAGPVPLQWEAAAGSAVDSGTAFQLIPLESSRFRGVARLTPIAFSWAGGMRVLVSDRGGQLLLPSGQFQMLDAVFSY